MRWSLVVQCVLGAPGLAFVVPQDVYSRLGGHVLPRRALAEGVEALSMPLLDDSLSFVSEELAGVYGVPHCEGADAAYVVTLEELGAAVLVGVPAKGAIDAIAERHEIGTWFLTGRVADGAAQEAVRAAFPEARRVVHRMDAGRGSYRSDDDLLLSAAGARRAFKAGPPKGASMALQLESFAIT